MQIDGLKYTSKDKEEDKKRSKDSLKIYLECLKPSYKYCILAFFLMLLDATFELLIPYLSGLLIRQGIEGYGVLDANNNPQPLIVGNGLDQPAMSQVYLYAFLIIGLAIFAIIAQTLAMNVAAKVSSDYIERLRNTLFYKMEQFSFKNIEHFPVSKMTTMLSNDCNNIRFFILMCIRAGFKSPIMIAISFILIFAQNWMIGLITIPFTIGAFLFISIITIKTRPLFILNQQAIDNVNNNVEEDTQGIKEVKAFCNEEHMTDKFKLANKNLTDISFKAFSRLAISAGVTQFAINITIALIQLFGGFEMIFTSLNNSPIFLMFNNGTKFDAGELSMLSNFTASLTMAFSFLSMLVQFFGRAQASKERLDKVFDEKIDISYDPKPKTNDFDPDHLKDGHITFKNVSFTYVDDLNKLALDNISLDIKSGTKLGIIGGTGSGKSSLVNLIPRLYDTSLGEVDLSSHNIKDYSLNAIRNDIGVVLQNNILFTGTIKENIMWGKKDASDDEILQALDLAQAKDFTLGFKDGLDTLVSQGGNSVSGGQKQRLCIARALIKKPKILILDDSTSACDMETERKIKANIFTKLKDMTTIIIAQRISSVKDCDMILVLDNGKEVGRGTHDQLLKTCKIYREIDTIQKKGIKGE